MGVPALPTQFHKLWCSITEQSNRLSHRVKPARIQYSVRDNRVIVQSFGPKPGRFMIGRKQTGVRANPHQSTRRREIYEAQGARGLKLGDCFGLEFSGRDDAATRVFDETFNERTIKVCSCVKNFVRTIRRVKSVQEGVKRIV